ncbi:LolA family protein [Candidatus Tokpelaia sp.]|uniref:LolA family protein n=1 Tax=Candidatus Tokpelaia sp. TaxID=2233777 RepID=UPI001238A935|nr:outer membrane lipoprotein carrier protein LolA [Candidatus Tokpelaia sp.]KAA6406012.1 hypothetical protein DPQ22_01700 [Candidatus Tokpelaia sp.]
MHFTFLSKTALPPIVLAAAIMLFGAALPPAGWAESFSLTQMGAQSQGEDNAPAPYSPPLDVPVPQPKFTSDGSADSAAPGTLAPDTGAPLPGEQSGLPPAPAGKSAGETKIGLEQAQKLAQILADKFSQIRVMMGEFVQFDPRGGMTTGMFYLERPGRILFDYKDSPLRVICDGEVIAVNNRKLRSWSLYELGKSPLNLLLADKINIANGRLLEFTQEANAVTLVLGDTTNRAKIRMIFDARTYDLKQWTMTENGQDTTIQILNTKTDIEFTDNMFNIDYYRFPERYKK